MSPVAARVTEDLRRLKELSKLTNNKVKVLMSSGLPINHMEIELGYPTVSSSSYPLMKQEKSLIHIDLLDNYPIAADRTEWPKITVRTPIFHPNIFVSGLICLGDWKTTEYLDFLVIRIVRTICFDPQFIDPFSPANSLANIWYKEKLRTNPGWFPTADLSNLIVGTPTQPRSIFRDS